MFLLFTAAWVRLLGSGPASTTVELRFPPPNGYFRKAEPADSFGSFLRKIPLKPEGTAVRFFDGRIKPNSNVYLGVFDWSLYPADLQQCADAVMRIRAEYLFANHRKREIGFHFVADGKMHWYADSPPAEKPRTQFDAWLKTLFSFASTASLHWDLKPRKLPEIQPGDVFFERRQPYGHCCLVLDVVYPNHGGNPRFMLAQSYMPAQDIQVLQDPVSGTAWFSLPEGELHTPEWTFPPNSLYRFKGGRKPE